jgi:rhamnogalacturonyl hydrolase YesR
VLIGIGWIVVVFAAIISYLEDKRSATRERSNQLERELKRVRDQLKEAQRNSPPK